MVQRSEVEDVVILPENSVLRLSAGQGVYCRIGKSSSHPATRIDRGCVSGAEIGQDTILPTKGVVSRPTHNHSRIINELSTFCAIDIPSGAQRRNVDESVSNLLRG
jgi:hypothetical protein